MTGRLCGVLAGVLRGLAGLLPAGRREWTEAVQAEAAQVPAGWPRLSWLAGGVWLAVREASMMRRFLYGLGCAAVAAAVGWVVWLSWGPAGDPEAVTDRMRILFGAAALVVLPWVGRRRGTFGPAGRSMIARLVRVAGAAMVCGLGLSLIRLDRHHDLHHVLGDGSASWLHEIGGLVAFGLFVAAPLAVRARWPHRFSADARTCVVLAGALMTFVLLPVQAMIAGYVALVLAATSRRAPARPLALGGGAAAGLLLAPALYAILSTHGDSPFLSVAPLIGVLAPAGYVLGLAVAWRVRSTWSPADGAGGGAGTDGDGGTDEGGLKLRDVQSRQATLAGVAAGAMAGLSLAVTFSLAYSAILILGPLVAGGSAAFGGMTAADHPRGSRPARSRMAGLFVSRS